MKLSKFFALLFFVVIATSSLLKKEILENSPKERKTFLAWDREEKWKRYIDRERFREDLVRRMQEMTRLHNTRLQMSRVQQESYLALQKRFSNARNKLDRMRDHTE